MSQRIAFAIEESGTKEIVAEHFSRCSKFHICELDEQKSVIKMETYFNPIVGEHKGVCQLPAYIKQFNVNVIIAGGMGQKAISNFQSYGIDVITAPGLEFEETLNQFLLNKLTGFSACNHS